MRARRIGAAVHRDLSRRPTARTGTGRSPGKTRPIRRGYRSAAWFMSPVSRSRGPGRRRLGPRVRGADRNLALPFGRMLDLVLIAAGRSFGGRRSGAVRA